MPTSITESNFAKKNNTDMVCLALGALTIVAFLSIAFLWFDATSLPSSNSTFGETHPPAGQRPAVKRPAEESPASQQDLIIKAHLPVSKSSYQFVPTAYGSSVYQNLNATFAFDKDTWRYTADGWRDISMMNNHPQPPKPVLENVHPAIWTAMLFLSSLLLLVMACSEQEIKQLTSRNSQNKA